jgi:type VI secretion system secreted protein Hcp
MSFDGFLEIDGIKGDSLDENHEGWIELESFNHDVRQSTGGAASAQGSHAGGRADHGDFSVVKRLDSASPALFMHVCTGRHIPKITIEMCRALGEKTVFMKYTMEDVIVAGVSPSGSTKGSDLIPLEEVQFRYGAIHQEYTPTDPRNGGQTGASIQAAWSTLNNKAL